ncbi:MAG TPA: VCBS repeat-containing protein [Cyclobacteriaceae bacterium]|nr:VCBS repeat-containing protein [Cyclobacteriaceae bacterium]
MRAAGLCVIVLIAGASCKTDEQKTEQQKPAKLFTRLESAVDFRNDLKDTDDFNIIEYLYYYNGAGVAAGDINNDGLCDLYFSSNQGSNKLFLNKGGLKFEDITSSSDTEGVDGWKTGVTMADVNGDGWLDIFVAGVGNYKKFDGRSQLLINNGDLTFDDRTEEYGLAFEGLSTHASFFDYDNDGDLDMYLVNHSVHSTRSLGDKSLRFKHDSIAGDRLYRNELVPEGKTHFTDVTLQAGILNSQIGYGLAVAVSDLNNDGWQDIYVSNDFHETDYMYINNQDGTFRQVIETSVPHTSRFSMGSSAVDINEDGWTDLVTLDMRPRDERIIKTTQQEDNYDIFRFKLGFGYHYQFPRNAMQISNGIDADGNLLFTDVAPYAGVDATDWSWAPVVTDFNNDGLKDMFITNGILRRPNDLDYINYLSSDSAQKIVSDETLASKMPPGTVPDMIFMNASGTDMTFVDMTNKWMDARPDISNGAIAADLDNDGDQDIVVNTLNDNAVVWRNNSAVDTAKFIRFNLAGNAPNTFGVGAKVVVSFHGHSVYLEQQPARGWESSTEPVLHAGVGNIDVVDSVTVVWPDRKFQVMRNVKVNQQLTLRQSEAAGTWSYTNKVNKILTHIPSKDFVHHENTFNPFEREFLLMYSLSTQGPCMAVGDFNGDKLDDYFIGGAAGQSGAVYFQARDGSFTVSQQPGFEGSSEDTAAEVVDVNGDGSLDLVIAGGGQEFEQPDRRLIPKVYLNNGRGQFRRDEKAIPLIYANVSCVVATDVDSDGDQDLFVGGLVMSKFYGMDPQSFVLINDGRGKFEDQTQKWISDRIPGMVTDAAWTDLNGDKKPDLVMVGEWMPVKIFINNGKALADQTLDYGLATSYGLWKTIAAADFDQDGDVDLVAGNMGLNSRLHASVANPVELYVGDIDFNFSLDQIVTYYNGGVKHPFISRDLLVKQVPPLKRKFLKYSDYGKVTLTDIIPLERQALHKVANELGSMYLENIENKKFAMKRLPKEAQYSSVFSILANDVDSDGNKDLLLVGNIDAVQPDIGRFDGSYGLILKGDGKGGFTSLPISSGFVVKGQGRDIKMAKNAKGETVYIVARNNDSVLYFK